MRATNQGGSLAGFLLIGALLTLVLVGGLYGLNRYNTEKASEEVATNDESSRDSAAEDKVKSEVKKETESEKSEETGRQTTEPRNGSTTRTETPSGSAAPQAQPAAQLPQTGPADTAFTLVALALVTFAGTHFIRSRQ